MTGATGRTRYGRRPSARAVLGALVAGVVALVLVGTHIGSAAALGLQGTAGRPWVQTTARCQSGPVAVTTSATGTASSVRVTGVDAACAGAPLTVTLYDPAVTSSSTASRRFTGTAPAAATTTVTGGSFRPAANLVARVTIGGWLVPSSWSWAPAVSCVIPSAPATPCTATVTSTNQWPSPPTTYMWSLAVSTTSPVPVAWQVTFNLSDPAFPFVAGALNDVQAGLVLVSSSPCGASPRLVTVRGTTAWGDYHRVQQGTVREMQIQGDRTGTGNLLTCR